MVNRALIATVISIFSFSGLLLQSADGTGDGTRIQFENELTTSTAEMTVCRPTLKGCESSVGDGGDCTAKPATISDGVLNKGICQVPTKYGSSGYNAHVYVPSGDNREWGSGKMGLESGQCDVKVANSTHHVYRAWSKCKYIK